MDIGIDTDTDIDILKKKRIREIEEEGKNEPVK